MSFPHEFFMRAAADGRRNRLTNSILNDQTSPFPEFLFTIPRLIFIYELFSPRFFVSPIEETFVVENNSQMSTWYYGTEDVTMYFTSQSFSTMNLQGTFEINESGSYIGISMLVQESEQPLPLRRRVPREKLLVWNCRGLMHNPTLFTSRFYEICSQYRPNIVLITETRLPEHLGRTSWIHPFPPSNLFKIAPMNGVGGMWLLWRTSVTANIQRTDQGFNAIINPAM